MKASNKITPLAEPILTSASGIERDRDGLRTLSLHSFPLLLEQVLCKVRGRVFVTPKMRYFDDLAMRTKRTGSSAYLALSGCLARPDSF
jgi:hypothetical protein